MLIFPDDRALIELDPKSLEIRYIESLEVLLVGRPQHDLLFLFVYFQAVHLFRPLQVSDAPLKPLSGVFSYENWLNNKRRTGLTYIVT